MDSSLISTYRTWPVSFSRAYKYPEHETNMIMVKQWCQSQMSYTCAAGNYIWSFFQFSRLINLGASSSMRSTSKHGELHDDLICGFTLPLVRCQRRWKLYGRGQGWLFGLDFPYDPGVWNTR